MLSFALWLYNLHVNLKRFLNIQLVEFQRGTRNFVFYTRIITTAVFTKCIIRNYLIFVVYVWTILVIECLTVLKETI